MRSCWGRNLGTRGSLGVRGAASLASWCRCRNRRAQAGLAVNRSANSAVVTLDSAASSTRTRRSIEYALCSAFLTLHRVQYADHARYTTTESTLVQRHRCAIL